MATEKELREVFNLFDTDKSGQISARELVNCLRKIMPESSSEDDIKALAYVSIAM